MIKYIYGLLLIPTFASNLAFAAYTNCRWTAEGTNDNFSSEEFYKQAPKMVASAACSSASGGQSNSNAAPTCIGQLYCESSSRYSPPQVVMAGCLAVKVSGKWSCPDATVCMADDDVRVRGVAQVPAPQQPAASRNQNSDTNQGMDGSSSRQGGGGR